MEDDNARRAQAISQAKYGYGYVYILKSPEGYRKIGKTTNPSQRMNQITPVLPFKIEKEFLFHCSPGNEGKVERLLHERFKSKRTNGEWFKLDGDDTQWLFQNPLPLPIAVSHAMCFAQECLKGHNEDHLLDELLGLS